MSLEVHQASLDDVPLAYNMISKSERVVALHQIERHDWRTARLHVRVTAPESELASGPWRSIACFAVLSERRTRTQTSVELRMQRPGEWSGDVDLQRDHHLGRAQLTGQLVATVDDVRGRTIATVNGPWVVDLEARTPTRRNAVPTRWLDFGDERNQHLNAFKDDPWIVEAVGDSPVLYLNSGFEGLRAILESTRVADRPARDALAAQIATNVWTVLFNAAGYQADVTGDQAEWPDGWAEGVLRKMLPDVFPDHSPNEALQELVNRQRTGDGGGDLQTRVLHAASKHARLPRNLGGLLRNLRRVEQEDR
jgi:hypothetical protein